MILQDKLIIAGIILIFIGFLIIMAGSFMHAKTNVKQEDIVFLGHGEIIAYSDKSGFGLYRELDMIHSVQVLNVSQEYINSLNLKNGDKIAYVMYPLSNGRKIFDVFKIKNN